MKRFFL